MIFDNLRIGKADAADFTDKLTFSTEVELSANGKPVINVQSGSADSHSESNKINVTTNHASMQEMSLGFSIRSKRGKETLENIRRLISK